jgi:hypothetical protein
MKENDHGYVRLMQDRERDYEHRKVWTKHNGDIPTGMIVHHLNGDSADNRIETLELKSQSSHRIAHSPVRNDQGLKRCTVCKEFKPVNEFAQCSGGSPQGPCKPCKAEYNKRYRETPFAPKSQRKSCKQSSK